MKSSVFEGNLNSILNQRNFLLILSCILSFSLMLTSTFLFFREERVVVVPAVVEKEFWVDANTVSATYLEQFGSFLGQLLLTKSSYSADVQKKILLRHVDPIYSSVLLERLEKEQENLSKGNGSYVFFITGIEVILEKQGVLLKGNRVFNVGNKVLSEEKECYFLGFSYKDGRLLLNRVEYISLRG